MAHEWTIIGIAAAAAAAGMGCLASAPVEDLMQPPTKQDVEKATTQLGKGDEAKVVAGANALGFNLFAELAKTEPNSNIFISPTSISFALAMTYNGAAGETQKAMASTLGINNLGLPEVDEAYRNLSTVLRGADPKVELAIANSLWLRKGIEFRPDFIDRTKQFFGAGIESLDFANPASVDIINRWVSDNTKGKIEKIVDELKPEEVMHLINAVYFKGKWSDPFEKSQTKDRAFHAPTGDMQIPMMSRSDKFRYFKAEGYAMVSIPYGDGRIGMVIGLPDANDGLDAMMAGCDATKWQAAWEQMRLKQGSVTVPRWKSEFSAKLNDPLKALGMGVAFTDQADFCGMRSQRDLYISVVQHKTFVQVDEEGTEAAAVTDVGVGVTSAPMEPETPFVFVADRPFFYAIQDSRTDAILFMGVVRKP